MFIVQRYDKEYQAYLIDFLQRCLPESNRRIELDGRHKIYYDITNNFKNFWCLFDDENIIGTVAFREIDDKRCELKSLYLFQKYQGRGLGYKLLMHAIDEARDCGYKEMYLDTLASSQKAICLYQKVGFIFTERYNKNQFADVFMVLDISRKKQND